MKKEKSTLSILENIRKKIQKIEEGEKIDINDENRFEYFDASIKNDKAINQDNLNSNEITLSASGINNLDIKDSNPEKKLETTSQIQEKNDDIFLNPNPDEFLKDNSKSPIEIDTKLQSGNLNLNIDDSIFTASDLNLDEGNKEVEGLSIDNQNQSSNKDNDIFADNKDSKNDDIFLDKKKNVDDGQLFGGQKTTGSVRSDLIDNQQDELENLEDLELDLEEDDLKNDENDQTEYLKQENNNSLPKIDQTSQDKDLYDDLDSKELDDLELDNNLKFDEVKPEIKKIDSNQVDVKLSDDILENKITNQKYQNLDDILIEDLEKENEDSLVDLENEEDSAAKNDDDLITEDNFKIIKDEVADKTKNTIKKLINSVPKKQEITRNNSLSFRSGETLEDLVIEILTPKLEQWLNQNLPEIVERIVSFEIKKIIPKED